MRLAPLLEGGADELEADFQQFYSLDLHALLDAGAFRRAEALASQLPAESRTVRREDGRAAWGVDAYLLALVADNLAFLRYEMSGGKGRKPRPVERPKPPRKARGERTVHGMSAEEVGAVLFAPRR